MFSDFEHVLTRSHVPGSTGGIGVLLLPLHAFLLLSADTLLSTERTVGSAEVLEVSGAIAPEVFYSKMITMIASYY